MCLILFAYHQHPRYPLILAANRDEYFQRPSAPANFWAEYPDLLAGKDLAEGGTWLGVTRQGRLAVITNYRDGQPGTTFTRSRGKLTLDYLTAVTAPRDYLQQLHCHRTQYNGFNLLVGDCQELYYYSNRQGDIRALKPGIYGLSNHLLNTPWPKVKAGRDSLRQAIEKLPDTSALWSFLQSPNQAPDHQLPDTGVPLEWERLLSAAFIDSDDYGTRASTLLLIDNEGEVSFTELSYTKPLASAPSRPVDNRVEISFSLDSSDRLASSASAQAET